MGVTGTLKCSFKFRYLIFCYIILTISVGYPQEGTTIKGSRQGLGFRVFGVWGGFQVFGFGISDWGPGRMGKVRVKTPNPKPQALLVTQDWLRPEVIAPQLHLYLVLPEPTCLVGS